MACLKRNERIKRYIFIDMRKERASEVANEDQRGYNE